ncbi:siderochrome iron transporter 2 [Aspergillus tubingensis]|uniref:Siderochrome iron transporter 2 n=1 Tax=Aspergillus tubingensis TaxID=5068 RepID=A0A8H3SSE9_ASPTU|nr:siderochrome-iron transporter [Aspergillus tubingensis]GFN14038.1 siderochrome-iron transporter [Aspergillus tubingensis]GLA65726.1 siderochrome iron transporter 2 [Aspergillus tubingensis]GLA73577.1 siderochrome iron transporter 2 [Aspergillus tubingensis]GLA88399.1 siderochrome iron transporter 2 [Aspergillus tubingensis]GLA94458.1 siderochrome iron transporter 2 [Aspergillus tubingensis]
MSPTLITRGRNDVQLAQNVAGADFKDFSYEVEVTSPSNGEGNPDEITLEAWQADEAQKSANVVTHDAPRGMQQAEAAALAWSKKMAYLTYALIWLSFFMLALQSSVSSNVIQNAYANFEAAPEVSTAGIAASVISGVVRLPAAKLLNVWGRTEGFLVFVGVYLLGLVILAACNNPSSYAAGYVLYWVGYDAVYLILDVFMADTAGMRNRAFAFGFASTPFICTAFTGPLAAESIIKRASWRWGYGIFAIVMPFVFIPLAVIFKFYQRKAESMYIYGREPSGRTFWESVVHYFHEFDVIGAFLLTAAFLLLLLPFSLASYGRAEYKSAAFISMIIIGFVLFVLFGLWERFGARNHFIKWRVFKQPTVIGACGLAACLFFSYYTWELYFYNFCMVVYDLSIGMAGYVGQIYNVGSCFWSAVFGITVYVTRQFKYTCLGFGLPLVLLGAGLMIHFRSAGGGIGYIVMCQIFIAFGGGTLVIGEDMAVMAASDREGVPMMLSLIGLFSSLGGAVGYAVAAAIYTNTFPGALRDALPEGSKDKAMGIYVGGYLTQLEYPVGSAIRDAINAAYGVYMKYACIAAVVAMAMGIPCVAIWKNFRLNKPQQNKGQVI